MANSKSIESGLTFKDTDALRRELEAKIEKKLPASFFYWVVGGLLTIALFVIGDINNHISIIHKTNKDDAVKLGIINDRVNELDSKLNIKH